MHAARLIVVDLALATLAEIAFREQLWLLVLQLAVRIRHELIVAYLSITSLISPVCTGTIEESGWCLVRRIALLGGELCWHLHLIDLLAGLVLHHEIIVG